MRIVEEQGGDQLAFAERSKQAAEKQLQEAVDAEKEAEQKVASAEEAIEGLTKELDPKAGIIKGLLEELSAIGDKFVVAMKDFVGMAEADARKRLEDTKALETSETVKDKKALLGYWKKHQARNEIR